MFAHIFLNRLKCLVRDRQLVFWTFLYPIILASLFGVAFSNIYSAGLFSSIQIAVVDNAEFKNSAGFQSALDAASKTTDQSKALFNVSLQSEQEAQESLQNNNIKGYILFQDGAHVIVKDSGIEQTIIKQFMDSYLQASATYKTVLQSNPDASLNMKFGNTDYISQVSPGKSNPNGILVSYYALIAMACLFGGFWGTKQIIDHQANLSPQGARINLAPTHKLKFLGYSLLAAICVHFISLLLLIAYMYFVIKVDFGNQLGYVLLTCLAGSVTGVSFGAFVGAITKKSENLKTAILIAASLSMSFLAGMMYMNIKYIITQAVPALAYLNPANLIADAFYSLYYYSTYHRFFLNILLLMAFSVVFYLIVYFISRRQKYASL